MLNWLKEPLLHFIVIGIGLFFLHSMVSDPKTTKESIRIDDQTVNVLISNYTKNMDSPPSPEVVNGLIDEYVLSEIYYREALALHLDQNDEIVKRRLTQKYQFIVEDLMEKEDVDTSALMDYYNNHKVQYQSETKYNIRHIYFNPDKRKNPGKDALNALSRLEKDANIDINGLGDKGIIANQLDTVSLYDISRLFGIGIEKQWSEFPVKKWIQISTSMGEHLIFIENGNQSSPLPFSSVVARVAKDYNDAHISNRIKDFNKKLKSRYHIEYDLEVYKPYLE